MTMKMVKCTCGHVVRGETDDEVVAAIEEHMRQDHPDLVGKISRDDILGWIEEI
jgi:predicted small metal-binding protein